MGVSAYIIVWHIILKQERLTYKWEEFLLAAVLALSFREANSCPVRVSWLQCVPISDMPFGFSS